MKSPLLKFIYDRKKVGSRTKEAPVELRITCGGKQKYLSTGVRVCPQHWKDGYMVRDRMDADELNETLNLIMKDVRRVMNEMMKTGVVNMGEITSRLKQMKNEGMSFLEFCEERVAIRKHGLRDDSAERYDRFMKFFKGWGKIVWFADVTDRNIVLLDEALSEKKMTAYSKWHNYHRFLNSFIIDAVNDGRLSRNPYKFVPIVRKQESKTLDKFLTLEEVERLKALQLSGHLDRARDLFIFQVHTCLAYADLCRFDAEKIFEQDGRKVYRGQRQKTGKEYTFILLEPALAVLEKYDGKLPIVSNQKYNDYLKVLAMMAGLDDRLSTHFARHTGATLLLNAGVEAEVVGKILGDTSLRIIRTVYAKLLDKTVVEAMGKAEEKLNRSVKKER